MPAFAAINVEPEDNVEDEVEVTRRIQIDDALKLYQTALKLHAQGPASFDQADVAYKALFKSSVFNYPEAKTDFERAERQNSHSTPGPSSVLDLALFDNSSGSSLLQTYYISHKNHAQFLLDRVRQKARTAKAPDTCNHGHDVFQDSTVVDDTRQALDEFGSALDRDPSDAELWRRTARVAAFLKSARIERFCLEAAIELDDDPAVVEVLPPSLAEGFAGEQLCNQLRALADDMSLSHPSMTPFLRGQMAAALKRYIDPLPWLPNATKDIASSKTMSEPASKGRRTIRFTDPSWSDLGAALAKNAMGAGISGDVITLEAPLMQDERQTIQTNTDQQLCCMQGVVNGSSATPLKTDDPTDEDGQTDKRTDVKEESILEEMGVEAVSKDAVEQDREAQKSRKRSQSSAGLADGVEEDNADTKRSKRIRRRETLAEEAVDPMAAFASQLETFQEADNNIFTLLRELLARLGAPPVPALDETIAICSQTEGRIAKLQNQPAKDMRLVLITAYKDDRARILLNKKDTPVLGMEAFLEHSKSNQQHTTDVKALDETRGLQAFVVKINAGLYASEQLAFEWLSVVSETYPVFRWSETMKTSVMQVIRAFDGTLFQQASLGVQTWQTDGDENGTEPRAPNASTMHLVQMVFELYLDMYEQVSHPSSTSDASVRLETKDRLDRWMNLAFGLVRASGQHSPSVLYRFLWASVFYTTAASSVSRDHALACWESLRQTLYDENERGHKVEIILPNNVVMSEVSFKAADREISKLTTMDFFLSLFQEELKDPVVVIDKLEPVLNPGMVYVPMGKSLDGDDAADATMALDTATQKPILECASAELRDMWKFLDGSSTDLRLFLWGRLADAYKEIDYPTKVLSCYLRSIELVADDLQSEAYLSAPQKASRLRFFVHLLKTLDEMMTSALQLAVNDASVFEIIDEDHICSSAHALARVSCMLHVATMHEDEVRIGMASTASNSQVYQNFQTKLREMQVRAWSLQYIVLKMGLKMATYLPAEDTPPPLSAASSPTSESTPRSLPASDTGVATNTTTGKPSERQRLQAIMAKFLGAVHNVVGLRKFCKVSNKIFLRLARSELLKMRDLENWEGYLGQILYDLHGLKLGGSEVQEHGCPTDRLERKNALQLVDKVMSLASGMSMKDLLKSDLKNTIEHMQQAIGQTKSTTQMIHNLRYVTEYLKRPIHPLRMYQAWKGAIELDTVSATTPDTVLARNGWFFLMAMVALTKFKSVDLNRRQTPGATDDLRVGAQYLRLQLQLSPARWDAWFRLAECSDYDLDETVLWSAEKMNKDRDELVKLQRSAIHGYTLALSYWHADPSKPSESDLDVVHDLHHSFGMRMYASSREPFAMEAFHHGETERWFIDRETLSTYKKPQHGGMTEYMVWKYAAGLFRRALARRAKDWKSAYMLSKCSWKMYQTPADALHPRERATKPTVDDVVQALEKSIEVVLTVPKPRHGDPILEPHYKIVSIVDKLVRRGDMHAQAAADILQRQPYAVDHGATVSITSIIEWREFMVKTIQHLRDKDKSNWQHRMTIRHARLLFGDCDLEEDEATATDAAGLAEGGPDKAHDDAYDATDKPVQRSIATVGVVNGASNGIIQGDSSHTNDKEVPIKDEVAPETTETQTSTNGSNAVVEEQRNRADATSGTGATLESQLALGSRSGEATAYGGGTHDKMNVDIEHTNGNTTQGGTKLATNTASVELTDSTPDVPKPVPLTAADKANRERVEKAQAAFTVLREAMFTKTMVMNVWKCDAERPGRHHVFTEQYIRFMTRLLVVLDDHFNLEALLRRIRKKGADFYHFNDLWQTCVMSYLRLLRQHYKIPHGADDAFKSVTTEEMEIYAERITDWVGTAEADHRAVQAMREAVEIKKLNGNLMKVTPVDDLISECYGVLFAEVGRTLPGENPAKLLEARQRQQREDAEKASQAERAEKAEKAGKDKQSETAAMMLTFNLLSDRSGGAADRDSMNGVSRAGSEAPGSLTIGGERMERGGSGMGGDQPQRRARVSGVRRPDILRRAEQAVSRLGEPPVRPGAPSCHTGNGTGTSAGAGTGHGHGSGSTVASNGRRSMRLGSSSGKNDVNMAAGEEPGTSRSVKDKDGHGSGADGDGSRARSTRSKSRHQSVEHNRRGDDISDGEDNDMKDAQEEDGKDDGAGEAVDTAHRRDAASEVSSQAGSLHDSADDESELSEVPADYEENAPTSPMFPNLRRSEELRGEGEEDEGGVDGDDEAEADGGEAETEAGTEAGTAAEMVVEKAAEALGMGDMEREDQTTSVVSGEAVG